VSKVDRGETYGLKIIELKIIMANLPNRYSALCWRPATHAQTWASYSALYRFGRLSIIIIIIIIIIQIWNPNPCSSSSLLILATPSKVAARV